MFASLAYLDAKADAKAEGLAEGKTIGLAEGRTIGLAEGKTIGLAEGKAEGLAEGLTKGKLGELISLVKDGALQIDYAAGRAGMTVEEFEAKMDEKQRV